MDPYPLPGTPVTATGGDAIAMVTARAEAEAVSLVWFLYADHGGIIRGKAAATPMLPTRMATGIGHTVAMMAMSMLDHLQPVEGMGPVGEVRIMPDPATFVPLPYAPGAGAMLADLVRPAGEPWEACARTYLKQAIADIAAEGYAVTAAFEPEFTLGRREAGPDGGPDRLIPADDSLCYSATGFHLAHDYTMDLLEALRAQGMQVEHYYPELGHGQQEMSLRHAPALRAAGFAPALAALAAPSNAADTLPARRLSRLPRSLAKRVIPSRSHLGDRCASSSTSSTLPPVRQRLSQSVDRAYSSPTLLKSQSCISQRA